jgi:hypothetical protein
MRHTFVIRSNGKPFWGSTLEQTMAAKLLRKKKKCFYRRRTMDRKILLAPPTVRQLKEAVFFYSANLR